MITFAGKKYAKNNDEVVESLFSTGGTCVGMYRLVSGGILLLTLSNEPFALIANIGGSQWCVTAHRYNGRTRYMQGLGEYTAKELGIDGMSYSQVSDECSKTVKSVMDSTVGEYIETRGKDTIKPFECH